MAGERAGTNLLRVLSGEASPAQYGGLPKVREELEMLR
jgi:hypothetical protein